jgi:tetratricopeptide (TPR) repeat protein
MRWLSMAVWRVESKCQGIYASFGHKMGTRPKAVKPRYFWMQKASALAVALLLTVLICPQFAFGAPETVITNALPQSYSEQELQTVLRQKLSAKDLGLITNPLAITPQLEAWANQLIIDATNDMQKAQALYDEMARRKFQSPAYFSQPGTAQQVFDVWNLPESSFRCQELAYLYVALARAVGLRAYFAFVEEDFRGQRDYHACPAVVFGDHILLFDPACWVGVIHKKFTVLNDVQTIALHVSASNQVEPCDIACRLAPELSIVQGHLFDALRQRGRRNQAKPHLEAMIRLDPEGGLTYYGRALSAIDENKFDQAIDLLGKGIEAAPQREVLHLQLGDLYLRNRKWAEAQQSYRAALNCPMDNDSFRWANALLAIAVAEECRSKNDLQGSLTNFDSAISSRPEYPEPYVYRGLVKQSLGDFEGASKDFETAISLKPELSKLIESLTGSQYPVRASSKPAFANQIAVFSAVLIALLLGTLLMTHRKAASKN